MAADARAAGADALTRRAVAAARRGDARAVAASLSAGLAAADPHVRLAVLLRAGGAVLALADRAIHESVAAAALDALRATPCEPSLWQLEARLLERLGAPAGAAACDAAAARLEALDRRPARVNAGEPGLGAAAATLAAQVVAPDPAAQRLTLAMIVRDEEAMLPGCLTSVAGVVDEIVVVDTGSTDRTVAIAREHGAIVVDFPWIDDFAAARNAGLERATGDWILMLDADERLEAGQGPALRAWLARTWKAALRQRLLNHTGESGMSAPLEVSALRLWRHAPHVRFEGLVHEQLVGLPGFCGERFADTPVRLVHHGYAADVVRAAGKRDRNLALLRRQLAAPGAERDAFLHFNLGSEHLVREEFAEAVDPLLRALELAAGDETPLRRLPYGPRLALRAVRALRLAGEPREGARIAERWLGVMPDHTDLAVERALCLADAGDPAGALPRLEAALAMGDGPVAYGSTPGLTGALGHALRGELLARLGRHAEAAASYRAGLRADPDYIAGIGRLAEALLATGAAPQAIVADLGPAARRHPRAGLPLLATALYEQGDLDRAQELYAEALALDPAAVDARLGLAECALSRGDVAAAAAQCDPLPPAPEGAALARCAAFCALVEEDGARAQAVLEQAARAGLPDADRRAYGAWLAALDGVRTPALDAAAAAAALDALGTAVKLERLPSVDRLYRLVRASDLPEPEAREELAQRFFSAGFTDVAADEWIAAAQCGEPRPRALLGLAQVALGQELLEDARNLAAEAAELDPSLRAAVVLAERLDEILARRS